MTINFEVLRKPQTTPKHLEIINVTGGIFQQNMEAYDAETGETVHYENGKEVYRPEKTIANRFIQQSIIRKILPDYRVSKCLRVAISKTHPITIHKNIEFQSISLGNLQTCSSVWHCPLCAAKISERRAVEIKAAFDYCKDLGGYISFITRTVPHTQQDHLNTIIKQFRDAETKFKGQRSYKEAIQAFNCYGTIKVYEITVGINGWHLHIHEIMLHHNQGLYAKDYDAIQKILYPIWKKSAIKAGFKAPTKEHGLQVQNGDFAENYLLKFGKESSSEWHVGKELSKQNIKNSRTGFSPFDLLKNYETLDQKNLLNLFREYAIQMHGSKQVIWSRGLKDLVEIERLTDDEICKKMDEQSILLGKLTQEQWQYILKYDMRAEVVIIAKNNDYQTLATFLKNVGCPEFKESLTE